MAAMMAPAAAYVHGSVGPTPNRSEATRRTPASAIISPPPTPSQWVKVPGERTSWSVPALRTQGHADPDLRVHCETA